MTRFKIPGNKPYYGHGITCYLPLLSELHNRGKIPDSNCGAVFTTNNSLADLFP